jgi:hypothetical protein
MKEINEVLKEYENRQKWDELLETYRQFQFKTRVLLKNDLCKMMDIDNFDNYTRLAEFAGTVTKNNKIFHLYMDNQSEALFFIARGNYEASVSSGIVLKTNHISDIDAKLILNIALEEQNKEQNKTTVLPDLLYFTGVLMLILGFFGFIFTLEEGFMAILVPIPFIISSFMFFGFASIINSLNSINEKLSKTEDKSL